MADVSTRRTRAFVSYSHADAEHLTRLHVHLAPYMRQGKVDVWDDTRIRPGMRWKEEIEAAIAQARVAILLVSADFLASEFIASDEVPPLLEAAEREGTLIVSVILSPSGFLRSKLARYQALNAPSDPLIDMPRGKQEAIWAKLAEYVADALSERLPFGTHLLTCIGHSHAVYAVAWSRDSRRLASVGDDKVQVWDAMTGQKLPARSEHTQSVNGIVWSPDGRRLASASSGKTVQVWDASTAQRLPTYSEHSGSVNGIAWSPDGRWLASGSEDKTVQVWEALTGQRLHTYAGHSGFVRGIAWLPDGRRLVSASSDKTVQVWSAG